MTVRTLWRHPVCLLFASISLASMIYQSPVFAQQSCGLFGPFCPSNQVCDFLGECRNEPGQLGQLCGAGVPCASNLSCSSAVGGRCERRGQSTQSCSGVGQGSCANGLVCDILGECRRSPPRRGELCGTGVPCAAGLACSAAVGGRCEIPGMSAEACVGIGQGSCADGLVCDVLGECRRSPPERGELCGTGVECAAGLSCSALVGGRCEIPGMSAEACVGIGQGSCADGFVCDVLGECRRSPPERGELCGTGVECAAGLSCSALVGGRCETPGISAQACVGIGQGSCASGFVCDIQGECRESPPMLGELCGIGVPCAAGLACSDSIIGGRCDIPGTSGESCIGIGQGSCAPGLLCDVIGECRSSPSERGEPCGATDPCAAGLACNAVIGGRCGDPVAIGDLCGGVGQGNCVDGALCQLAPETDGSGFALNQRCTPEMNAETDNCALFYGGGASDQSISNTLASTVTGVQLRSPLALTAQALGTGLTFGAVGELSGGLSGSAEAGVVYGSNGEFGCYFTTCVGALTNVEVGVSACAGLYNSYSSVEGLSAATVESVSPIPGQIVEFSTAQVFSDDLPVQLIGTSSCLGVSAGVLPVDVGVYACETAVVDVLTATDNDGDGVPNSTDECPQSALLLRVDENGCNGAQRDANGDGVSDSVAEEAQLDPDSSDTDGDGVADVTEMGDDLNNPLDSDFDGVIDALEPGEAAMDRSVVAGLQMADGTALTIRTDGDQAIMGAAVDFPSSSTEGLSFPLGAIRFRVTTPAQETASITLEFDRDLPAEFDVYNLRSDVSEVLVPSTYWRQSDARVMVMSSPDGDPALDQDGPDNGTVDHFVAIGLNGNGALQDDSEGSSDTDESSSSSGGGGGGAALWIGLILVLRYRSDRLTCRLQRLSKQIA